HNASAPDRPRRNGFRKGMRQAEDPIGVRPRSTADRSYGHSAACVTRDLFLRRIWAGNVVGSAVKVNVLPAVTRLHRHAMGKTPRPEAVKPVTSPETVPIACPS